MAKYRKKPVVIEAIQYTGTNVEEILTFGRGAIEYRDGQLLIVTPEGTMLANLRDWVIEGVKKEFYPCKDQIFGLTYESAEE